MAEENTPEVKEIENSFDTNPSAMSEEGSVETELVKDVGNVESVVSEDQEEYVPEVKNEVPKPQNGSLRRHSTGTIGKAQVQSRYRGNHRVASTHDLCKHGELHGKKCDQDNVVKPWKKNVRRKSAETSEETSALSKKSLGSPISTSKAVTKLESSVYAKRDLLAVKKKPFASVNLESSSVKHDSCQVTRSLDGMSVKINGKGLKKRETANTLSGSADVEKKPCGSMTSKISSVKDDSSEIMRSVDGSSVKTNDKAIKKKETANSVKKVPSSLRNEKSNIAIEKAAKISDIGEISKDKQKAKIQEASGEEVKEKTGEISVEDVKEKTVCVVESSVKGISSKKKKTMTTSGKKSPTKKIPGSTISTGLNTKKEKSSLELAPNPKPEMKIRPTKTGVKVTLAKQLSFKRGKALTPKTKDPSSPSWIKFRKRVTLEKKPETEGNKRNLKPVTEKKPDACESSKRVKVVLRHQNVEGKKKMFPSFNNVIEETMNKLTKMRKSKVKALVGAFETVISLQETKPSQKVQSKASTSASQVSPEQ